MHSIDLLDNTYFEKCVKQLIVAYERGTTSKENIYFRAIKRDDDSYPLIRKQDMCNTFKGHALIVTFQ